MESVWVSRKLPKCYSSISSNFVKACNCNKSGSKNIECSKALQCNCKENIKGLSCNSCIDNHFGFPQCQSCQCDQNGSVNLNCDDHGKCSCKTLSTGNKCNKCVSEYFKAQTGKCTGILNILF